MSKTMFEKIWDSHVVGEAVGGTTILYIDRHLIHEVTSPQAFAGLRLAGRSVHRPDATIGVLDHNIPTVPGRRMLDVVDDQCAESIMTLEKNAQENGITLFKMSDARQGIVHVIGPEQGLTLPGMTIVCGDSHTSTHGALGALAFGIGTSEV
ncbi:MAG: aconitase family protein, partial [Ktedonobacteraceae bacterium]